MVLNELYETNKQNSLIVCCHLTIWKTQVHCIYGYGIDTPETFEWSKSWFPDYQPSTNYGDGDGTVNRRSLEACGKWIGKNDGKKVLINHIDETANFMCPVAWQQLLFSHLL